MIFLTENNCHRLETALSPIPRSVSVNGEVLHLPAGDEGSVFSSLGTFLRCAAFVQSLGIRPSRFRLDIEAMPLSLYQFSDLPQVTFKRRSAASLIHPSIPYPT